jgi:hypothetical protein
MLSRATIDSGPKVRLLADLGFFLEGTEGVIQHVRGDDTSIWHAVIVWRCPIRKRRTQGILKPQDLDFVEAVPQKRRTPYLSNYQFHSLIDYPSFPDLYQKISVTSSMVKVGGRP